MDNKYLNMLKHQYRIAVARTRNARSKGHAFGVSCFSRDVHDIRAQIHAVVRDRETWMNSDGVQYGTKTGLVVGEVRPNPGIWYGGAGF
jgi:hypothetical protein